ncbi:Solute carrier family 22 member 13 [Chionoecetes opilio]|uniref:Solute carrier family 22 member 13 n=1 Tax=Chionoecetes opilio TaxID=41210 RepID=A0A8J8WFE7_CHIOP|nr:Solute carrier family 22 member 13 [Chionoecetes opilio]
MLQTFNPFHPALRFRWVKKLFPNLSIIRHTEGYMAELLAFIEGEVEAYRQEMGDQVDTGCYIGAYLNELSQLKPGEEDDQTTLSVGPFSRPTSWSCFWRVADHLLDSVVGRVLPGSNPEAQRTMQEEMGRVWAATNTPRWHTWTGCRTPWPPSPRCSAWGVSCPLPSRTKAPEDVSLGGYRIPKDTTIMFNLSHGLLTPSTGRSPPVFPPERFLTEEGKVFKPDHFMPFGSGKRVCLGESLARLEVFVFLASLMHRFSWRLADDNVTWETSTILSRPPNFFVYAVSREEEAKTRKIRKITLITFCLYFITSMGYIGLSLGGDLFSTDPFVYMIISGAMDIPGTSLIIPVVERFGRRRSNVVLYFLTAMSLLGLSFIPTSYGRVVMTLALLGRLTLSACYQVIFLHGSELFPTEVRARGMSNASMMARISAVFTSFLLSALTAPSKRSLLQLLTCDGCGSVRALSLVTTIGIYIPGSLLQGALKCTASYLESALPQWIETELGLIDCCLPRKRQARLPHHP